MGFVLRRWLVLQFVRTAGISASKDGLNDIWSLNFLYCEVIVQLLVTMDPGVKRIRKSLHKCKLERVHQAQQDLERPVSDKSDNYRKDSINCDRQSNDKEILLSQWEKGQEFICAKSHQAAVDTIENKFIKVRHSLLQNTTGSIDQDFNEQAMESLQKILAGTDLLKKQEAATSVHGLKYEGNLDQQKHLQIGHMSKALHFPLSYLIRSNSTKAVECSSHSSKVILEELSKCRERSRNNKSSSLKSKHLDFFEVVKEQLQQKDMEIQHLVHLLMVKQQELKDMSDIAKQKEMETQHIAEKLKCQEQKNAEIAARFDHICEDMRKELSAAKSDNKNYIKQLKALLEKYERLKTRANTVKDQLNMELKENKSSHKALKKLKQVTQELLSKQKHLEEQRDAAARDLSLCRETLQMMDMEHKKNTSINQRREEEMLALRTESANLKDHLCKAQEKNKELIQLAHSKESDKEKNVKESQGVIEKLNAELEECQTEKDKVHQQLEAIKHESKLIHNKQKVEMLQMQEQQKACLQQSDVLRGECETLMDMVNKLKTDKQVLTDKLETVRKEKVMAEMASTKEKERLKEAFRLLERERKVLLAEMEDLRKDYLGISDRITQKMGHMDAADPPMSIADITSNHQRKTQKVPPTDDVIKEIRRKLEEEIAQQS